ncbi:MAG: Zn-dependent oligopeptidase [Deltaproteobacteria bacterium]|nr:Zn-dependent oligopeptidase [Deltaproteobacteria bacterium]
MSRSFVFCTFLFSMQACTHLWAETTENRGRVLNWELRADQITESCKAAQTHLTGQANSLLAGETPSVSVTLLGMDRALTEFSNEISPLDFYRHVLKDAKLQEAAKQCYEESEKLILDIFSRQDFYDGLKAIKNEKMVKDLVQERLLEKFLYQLEANGMGLKLEKRQTLLALKEELIQITSSFEQVLNNWEDKLHFSKSELEGLPTSVLEGLEKSDQPGKDFVVTLQYPHYFPVMKYVKNPKVREEVYRHFNLKGGVENRDRLKQAVSIRLQIANLLGYKNFAEFSLKQKMVRDPETVLSFLDELKGKLKSRTKKELAKLGTYKKKEHGKSVEGQKLDPWDIAYYDNQLVETEYKVNEEEIKTYFPVEESIERMLDIYQTLMGVDFVDAKDEKTWHPDVRSFQVVDRETKKIVAKFHMDLFPREGKYGHAAAFTLISGYKKEDGNYEMPISSIVANFNKPTAEQPALLTHDQLETLYHEFGHIMHQVLTTAPYGSLSGTSVKRDFVEAPSQMLENWVWENEILGKISSHYKTGKPMPSDLMDRLIKTRYVNRGIFYSKQIFYGSIDMAYHTLKDTDKLDTTKLYRDLYEQINFTKLPKDIYPEASFGHIMGGYEAGYYGYLWSEVYAQDMFTRFAKEGLLNPQTGKDYRRIIVELGDTKDPMDLIVSFLGRKPNNEAFLRQLGQWKKIGYKAGKGS